MNFYASLFVCKLTLNTLTTLFAVTIAVSATNVTYLRGVTILNEPYVMKIENTSYYEGYCIDVINEIAKIVGFEYYLYESPDGTYGRNTTGLVGEVWSNKADFAIADITVTDYRKRFIDFTEPIMNSTLSALVRKSYVGNMNTFEDIADQTKIPYGTMAGGIAMYAFKKSDDMLLQRMAAHMSLVNTTQEGVERAITSRYIYIFNSLFNQYIVDNECDLTHIVDDREYFRSEYAIVLPKGSPYRSQFNDAIARLKSSGTLDELRDKYFKQNCLAKGFSNRSGGYGFELLLLLSFNASLFFRIFF